jgi:hypothetical protein
LARRRGTTTDVFAPAALALVVGVVVGQVADGAVAAPPGARLLVIPDVAHVDASERVASALRARGLSPVAAEARIGVDGVADDAVRGDRERVRALLGTSRAASRALDLEVASTAAAAALDEAWRLDHPEDQRELIVDVLLHDASLRLGRDKQDPTARAALRLAARLEPTRAALDPALHPPSVVAAFAQARDDNAAAGTALVVVDPLVIGVDDRRGGAVEVSVDGVVVDVVDRLLSLSVGPHLVTFRASGCRTWSRVVDFAVDTPPLQPVLQPPDAPTARATAVATLRAATASDVDAAFSRLSALTGADVVVALGRPARVWRSDVGVRIVDADVADAAAFAAAVERALRPARPPASTSTEPAPAPRPAPAARPVVDEVSPTPTFVVVAVVVGAVVAGGVAAAVLLWPGTVPDAPPRPVVVTAVVP